MVHRFRATLSLLLALGALLAACHDAERSLAPRLNGPRFNLSPTEAVNGKIAFHSTRDGDFQIYVMNPDGSGVARVTNDTGGSVDPIWSPDGKRIAYANFHSGRSEVFVINVVGTGETQLTTEGGFPGAWSPDGTRIAFANSSDGDDEIFLMNPDGSGVTRLTDNTFRDFPTAWSPNGAQILFQSDREDGDEEIYVMNADGSGVTRLTHSPGRDEGDRAGWSPDGARIVFSSDRDGGLLHVFVMNADGSGVTQLTSGDFVDDDPVWSPDGQLIAFHSTRDGGDEDIFVMNADGSGVTQLTFNDGVFDAVPVWTQLVSVSNDAFATATVIGALPFSDVVDISAASMEAGEPTSSCSGGASSQRTVWYAFTPAVTAVVRASVNASFSTVVGVYTGGLGALAEITCRSPFVVRDATFLAQAGTTYHIQVDGMFGQTGVLEVRLEAVPAPPNDRFVDATSIPSLPFNDTTNLTAASLEVGEPTVPSCARPYGPLASSAWYRFTPTETGSISASAFGGFPTVVAAYTGTSVSDLTEVGCGVFGGRSTFRAVANTTYYFQVGGLFGQAGSLEFRLEVTPLPVASFGFSPFDASVFDAIQFFDQSFDPGGVGFAPQVWNFGDGTTGTGFNVTHRYAADGDYPVQLTVTTLDGRTAMATQTVHVRTHDVAITRFATPNVASSGQTRRLVVSLTSKRYAEAVEVQVFKSVPGGFQMFGSLTQSLPLGPGNGTTDFAFSYTFTGADAQIGKVTFRAIAVIAGARDALPADNEAIAPATKVTR